MSVPGDNPATSSSGPAPLPRTCGNAEIPWDEASQLAHSVAQRLFGHQDRHVAEDVAQESLLSLKKHEHRIRVGWRYLLCKIVLNNGRRRFQAEDARRCQVCSDTTATETTPAQIPTVQDLAAIKEQRAALKQRCAELDQKFGRGTRAIVDFRSQGMSWQEIEYATGIPDRTCRDRHKKAITWLQARLSLEPMKGAPHE